MELSLIKSEINTQLADKEVVQSLLATTFKGLSVDNMKAAIMEGMIRGFSFKDFLEKNVYAIKYGQGYSLVTSIDNNRKIGQKSGVVGVDAPIYTTKKIVEDGKEVEVVDSCTITVKKLVRDVNDGGASTTGEFTATVYFDEYYKAGKTYEGKYTPSMWDKMPRTMIAKVAEMHALRKACPEELSQQYIEEETEREIKTIHVDAISLESCSETLFAATTLAELRYAWAKVPVAFKPQLEVIKEEKKRKLSPPAEAAKPAEPVEPVVVSEEDAQ